MMVAVWAVVLALFGHWVFDFVLQPHWMSMRKSKEWGVLARHATRIAVGSTLVGVAVILIAEHPVHHWFWAWVLANAGSHFLIDAVTSRITSRLYAKEDYHNFFVVIGFDQFLHVAITVATLTWIVSW